MSTLGAWFCCETLEMHEETYTMRIYIRIYTSKTYIIVNNTQNPKPNLSTTIFFSIWQWKPPVAQVGLSLKNSDAWYCRTYLYFRIQISSLDIGRGSKNKSWFPINKNDLPDFENSVILVITYGVCRWKRSKIKRKQTCSQASRGNNKRHQSKKLSLLCANLKCFAVRVNSNYEIPGSLSNFVSLGFLKPAQIDVFRCTMP